MTALFALFIRSLREDSRAKLPPIFRTALVAIILLIVWVNQRDFTNDTAPGRTFFAMVMTLNLSFIALAALSIFPSAIAEEKEDDTLTLLRMTNLSALSILFGKSTTRLIAALLLLAVQVPFTLMAITLGGVSMAQVWGAYAVLGATTFFLCNLALVASVFCRNSMRAGFLTAVLGAALYGLLPFIGVITTRMSRGGPFGFSPVNMWDYIAKYSVECNPMFALFSIVEPRGMGGRAVSFATPHVTAHLVGGVICFVIAWLIFDRYCSAPEEIRRRAKKTKDGRPRRWGRVSRAWCRRPIAWKEYFFASGGRSGFVLRLLLGVVIFAAMWGFARWEYEERVARYAQYAGQYTMYDNYSPARIREQMRINMCAGTLAAVGMCAGLELLLLAGRLFGPERRRQTLASLVALPWSVGKIVRQKILGAVPVFFPWLIIAIASLAVLPHAVWSEINRDLSKEFLGMSWRHDREEICAMIYVGLQALLLLVTIVWFSLRIRRGALPAAIAVLAVWNIAFGVCVDELHNRNEWLGFLIGAMVTAPALFFACIAVHRRIQLAAAEE